MTRPKQSVTHVPIDRLRAHPANIRDDLGDLTEMALSIKEHGILQPLTATEDAANDGMLLLLAGHRRLGGAILAQLDTVPVIIRHGITDPTEHLVVMLVENTQRRDLNPIERAEAYGALKNQGLTGSEIARRTGAHPSTVAYYLNFLHLEDEDRELVRSGERSSTQAVAQVRERRQEERVATGKPLRGRPKRAAQTPWFGPAHRLFDQVVAQCTHADRPKIGRAGCGPCWESALYAEPAHLRITAADELDAFLAEARPYDESVVLRRLDGDHTVRMRKPDRVEIVRRCHLRGMNDNQAADLVGLPPDVVQRVRNDLGLPPHGNGRHHQHEQESA